jgi:hypothetical protein
MTTQKRKFTLNKTKLNLILDIVILLVFLVDFEPALTGLIWHEWLGMLLIVLFMVHMLLHWRWVVETSKRIFRKLARQAKINFILNLALLTAMVLLIGSGVMISHAVLPFFGLRLSATPFWRWLHTFSADLVVWIVALHIALHWSWIVIALKRYLVQPMARLFSSPQKPELEKLWSK